MIRFPDGMKNLKYLSLILTGALLLNHALAQSNDYPDSLKSLVIKIEPLSPLFGHLSGGIEVPLGKSFLDINLGASNIGTNTNYYGTGGVVAKAGIKLPFKFNSPFNILYAKPELALSHYKAENYYDPLTNNVGETSVKSKAIMVSIGFRHISPVSLFYFDAGFDLGYGWSNHAVSNYQYNFFLANANYTSGVAISCHLATGIRLRNNK